MLRFALALLLSGFCATTAHAGPLSFTGAELASHPGKVFSRGASVSGSSLILNGGRNFGTLFRLSLDEYDVDLSNFEFRINFTRLPTGSRRLHPSLGIYLSDSSSVLGSIFNSFSSNTGGVGGRSNVTLYHGVETNNGSGVDNTFLVHAPFQHFNPLNNINYVLNIQVSGAVKQITSSLSSFSTATATTTTPFNALGDLSLIFVGQYQYQINSLNFTRGVSAPVVEPEPSPAPIPSPGMFGIFALALSSLGYLRKNRLI